MQKVKSRCCRILCEINVYVYVYVKWGGGHVNGRVDVARIEQHIHSDNNQEFEINPILTDDQIQKL